MSNPISPYSLDQIFTASSVGSLDKALANNIYGLNNTQLPGFLSSNRDNQGFIFATRPQLNLQKFNIRNVRELYPLLTDDPKSLAKAIRMILDPRIGAGYTIHRRGKSSHVPPTSSYAVDNDQAFIPFITNNAISSSGWPDMRLNTSTSDPGLFKQVVVLPDDALRNYGENDITINLQNTTGDPATLMCFVWIFYMKAVKLNYLSPYFDYLFNNRRDFDTRLYRIVLDQNKDFVTKIMATGPGFPVSCSIGMFGDFNRATPFSEQTNEISINFKTVGSFFIDPLIISHFNTTVKTFNPSMKDEKRFGSMVKLSKFEYPTFRHRCYPRIDEATMAFEWWAKRSVYDDLFSNAELSNELNVPERF